MPPNTAVCRICLAMDVRLHTISGTPLQRVYENLTKAPLHTVDKRPVAACYICYGLLCKCRKLMLTAAKAENVLTTIFNECDKITVRSISLVDRKANGLCAPLIISGAEYFDNIPVPIKVEDVTKTEPDVEDGDIEVKHEVLDGYNRETLNISENGHSEEADTSAQDVMQVDGEIPVTSQQDVISSQESESDEESDTNQQEGKSIKQNKIKLQCNDCNHDNTEQKQIKDTSTNKKRHKFQEDLRAPSGEKLHKSDVCQRTSRHNGHLNRHTKARSSKKSYECNVCQKQFKCDKRLENHSKIHSEETPYKCDVCQCSFKQMGNLVRHSKSMHSIDVNASYDCDICEQKFSRKDYLKNHLRKHTGEKPFECEICQDRFSDQSNYRRHLRKHTHLKPYVCNICECKFSYKQHLQVHLRKHSGEKPYQCTYCPQKFSHQSHLKTHTRTHTGEKPYECDVCQRRFARHTHLLGHKCK